jgi:uncharacterized protein YecE (DUF72 family)
LEEWLPHLQKLMERHFPVFGYVNNHYAGYAPDTVALLLQLLANPAAPSAGNG